MNSLKEHRNRGDAGNDMGKDYMFLKKHLIIYWTVAVRRRRRTWASM